MDIASTRAIVFDLDDTLYPEWAFTFSGYQAVARAFAERLGARMDELVARMRELFDTPDRGRVFDVVIAELEVANAESLVPKMIETFRSHKPAIQLHPDADVALTRLHGQYSLGLLTDGPLLMQRSKIEALGLQPRFNEIILTDQWGREHWKPHPKAFQEMSARLGVPHAACTYVADNPAKDFLAPNVLGWRTVFVRRPDGIYRDKEPPAGGAAQITIQTLDALPLD